LADLPRGLVRTSAASAGFRSGLPASVQPPHLHARRKSKRMLSMRGCWGCGAPFDARLPPPMVGRQASPRHRRHNSNKKSYWRQAWAIVVSACLLVGHPPEAGAHDGHGREHSGAGRRHGPLRPDPGPRCICDGDSWEPRGWPPRIPMHVHRTIALKWGSTSFDWASSSGPTSYLLMKGALINVRALLPPVDLMVASGRMALGCNRIAKNF